MRLFCSHNFVYTHGHLYCSKCGKKTPGKPRKKIQIKKIGVGITLISLIGIVGFFFSNGVFEINEKNISDHFKNIPTNIPKEIQIPIQEKTKEITTNIYKQIDSIKKDTEIDKIISLIPKETPVQTYPNNCDHSYPDVCIPPYPPGLDCSKISYNNFKVLQPDPHGFDKDKDGIGCEK